MALKWDDTLSVGIAEIDNQHQELFNRINSLSDAYKKGAVKEEIARVMRFLTDYIIGHFIMEENYMTEYDYPLFTAHKTQHEEFIKACSDLKSRFQEDSGGMGVMAGTAELLGDWWINHINEVDMELGRFLKTRI